MKDRSYEEETETGAAIGYGGEFNRLPAKAFRAG